jgi:chromosome segregation ATPase
MSKAVKQSILILVLLLIVSIAVALMTLLEKQKLQSKNQSLSQQVADFQSQQTQLVAESTKLKEQVQTLTDQLASKDRDRSKFQTQYEEIKSRYDQLSEQVDHLTKERDDYKDRTSTVGVERDRLMKELQNRPQKVVEKIVYKEKPAEQTPPPVEAVAAVPPTPSPSTDAGNKDADKTESAVVKKAEDDSAKQQQDESHWAEVFKQKAALEIEINKSKKALDESALQIVDLKKQVADMQLVIDKLSSERDEIVRKIKYGEDLADNLSIELARAKNDQKFTSERAEKLTNENSNLQTQVKQLTSTKVSLEKTISRLSEDKENIQKKLIESESVIQSRIDDIWKIKQNIDQRVQTMPKGNENQVELAPIVINANATAEAPVVEETPAGEPSKNQAHIVSINQDNNFVIIDMGEKDGIKMGDAFRVYRGSKEIARLEVIQLRRDIAAADIKKKTAQLQVGDLVR